MSGTVVGFESEARVRLAQPMNDRGLEGLVGMYETAIAALQRLRDPEVEELIIRLEARQSYVLQLIEHQSSQDRSSRSTNDPTVQ